MLVFKTVVSEKMKTRGKRKKDYLKLKSSLGAAGAWWDILIGRDVLRRDPQRGAPSTVTQHLNITKHCETYTQKSVKDLSNFTSSV